MRQEKVGTVVWTPRQAMSWSSQSRRRLPSSRSQPPLRRQRRKSPAWLSSWSSSS
uniref:Rhodopsin n=1 Tax=Mus musculus TaxID=10090 RepID=A0A0N4SWC6_MOUSE